MDGGLVCSEVAPLMWFPHLCLSGPVLPNGKTLSRLNAEDHSGQLLNSVLRLIAHVFGALGAATFPMFPPLRNEGLAWGLGKVRGSQETNQAVEFL